MACLSACVPKKVSPSDEAVLHDATLAAQEQKAPADDDEDGAWEADDEVPMTFAQRFASGYKNQDKIDFSDKASGSTGELLTKARTALGTPYVRGGTSRSGGFDCSGFVQWTYNHVGIQLPRTAREQSQVGKAIRDPDDMQAGDIVAFRHPKRGYHTGIYVGDGKFIHSPRKRNVVRINSLDDPYFSKTFFAVRRLNVNNEGDIEAAEQMLAAYAANPAPKVRADRSSRSKKKSSASMRASKSKKTGVKTAGKNQKTARVVAQNSPTSKDREVGKNAGDSDKNSAKKSTTASKSTQKKQSDKTEKSKKSSTSKAADTKKNSVSNKKDNTKTETKSTSKAGTNKSSAARSSASK